MEYLEKFNLATKNTVYFLLNVKGGMRMKRFRRVTAMLLSMCMFFGSSSAVVLAQEGAPLVNAVIEAVK